MDQSLFSRITKDFLELDPVLIPSRERYRMGWGGSVLVPHAKAQQQKKEKNSAVLALLAMRERFAGLFSHAEAPPVYLSTSPRLGIGNSMALLEKLYRENEPHIW